MKFVITSNDIDFPENLKIIKNPPKKIWCEGNVNLLKKKSISIVGTRRCTEYGKKWCEEFTRGFLEYGLVIVSGMAIGIDTVAHKSALKYKCETIAVLPSGLNSVYPKENIELYKEIIKNNGLVISEYDENEKAEKRKFLERNRIVAGLGIGTLVVEAGVRSGTGVTARYTLEQGKEVFCIPGNLENEMSKGTNRLIKNGKAKLVSNIEDIVKYYQYLEKIKSIEKYEKKANEKELLNNISPEYIDIYKLILQGPMNINEIIKELKISVSDVMSKITIMELDGKIRNVGGKFFVNGEEKKKEWNK